MFLIVLENHSYGQVVGRPDAPYLNRLAGRYGLATDYHAVAHPSLPNYLALTGGSTFGIASDCSSCSVRASNLADQLESKGLTWRSYAEGLPEPCDARAGVGRYAKKHNPFLYYEDVAGDPGRCRAGVVPLGRLTADVAAGPVPSFSLIVPDLCRDMHDCAVAAGDAWLRGFLPTILSSRAYSAGGIVLVTFDEDDGHSQNHVATLVISPKVGPGTRYSAPMDHYGLLRAIEDVFGLPHLARAAEAPASLPLGSL